MGWMERSAQYIGRRDQKDVLCTYSQRVVTDSRCYVLALLGEGGLGKTRMLQTYPDLIKTVAPTICCSEIVDFYSFENRSAEAIERQLIEGLKQVDAQQWYRLPAEAVDTAFTKYHTLVSEYRQARQLNERSEVEKLQAQIRSTFIECWNTLAHQRPLVMLFDTLELLFTPEGPQGALIQQEAEAAMLVRDWMRGVLRRLEHTLVVLSGRPLLNPPRPSLADELVDYVAVHIEELDVLKDPQDIIDYLSEYNVEVDLQAVPVIFKLTAGRPLLLTCYAQTLRDDNAKPPRIPVRPPISSRAEFEAALVSTILDPNNVSVPPTATPEQEVAYQTLVYSLYFLACARRGIRRKDLRKLFEQIDLPIDEQVIERIDQVALVKTASRPPSLPAHEQSGPVVLADDPENGLLLLHDEIYLLIDTSGKPRFLGIYDDTINYLCNVSRKEVQEVNALQLNDRTPLLRAMSDHIYYELTRHSATGYRIYTVYTDRLLRERDIDGVILLSNALWSTLLYSVDVYSPPSQTRMRQRTLLERLVETNKGEYTPQLTEEEILRDEQVRHIKLDNARDLNADARLLADELYERFTAERLILKDGDKVRLDYLPGDQYLFADFSLTRANALAQTRSLLDDRVLDSLFENLIAFLESPDWISDEFLRLRRLFLLGESYKARAFIRRQQQRYNDAEMDAEQARNAYKQYDEMSRFSSNDEDHSHTILNDFIVDEIAQVTNNLAYNLLQKGDFRRALRLSNEAVGYIPHLSIYRRALIYNTKALIHLRRNEYVKAQSALEKAQAAAAQSGNVHAQGLVSHALAMHQHEVMRARGEPDVTVEERYDHAARLLQSYIGPRLEVYYDWARYKRDIGNIYASLGDHETAQICHTTSLAILEQAIELPGISPMLRADLRESQATVLNIMRQHTDATQVLDEAEAILRLETLPMYGQVVCGKIALQRAMVALSRGDYDMALQLMLIALARAYTFGPLHRDQRTFERIADQIVERIPEGVLVALQDQLDTGQLNVLVEDLPYHQPLASVWGEAWQRSVKFVRETIAIELEV